MRAFGFTRKDIDLIISSAIMSDPLDAYRESVHNLFVEHSDAICGDVMSVDAHGALIFATFL